MWTRWCMVWSPKTTGYQYWGEVTIVLFLLFFLEYDFYFINWTRADFAPQIQINKWIWSSEHYIRLDEPYPYPVRRFTYRTEHVRAYSVHRSTVYSLFVSRFSGLTFCATATGTVPVCLNLSRVSGLGLGLSVELKIQSRVVFTIRSTQLHRSCISSRYSIRLRVLALHISDHHVGHGLTYYINCFLYMETHPEGH
jgi:hypothetical protein